MNTLSRVTFVFVLLTVSFLPAGCDIRRDDRPSQIKEKDTRARLSVGEALSSGTGAELEEAVERSKRAGFPNDDLAAALTALQDELGNAEKRDIVVVALSDLVLQAERNRFLSVPVDLREKLFAELIRIQAADSFPTNLRALSVIGFFNSETAARKLQEFAIAGSEERFLAAVNALSIMCHPSAALALEELKAIAYGSKKQEILADARKRLESQRQFCR